MSFPIHPPVKVESTSTISATKTPIPTNGNIGEGRNRRLFKPEN